MENKGTIIQTGAGNLELANNNPAFPTTLQNDAGALYEIEGDSSIVTLGSKAAIVNAGIIEKTGGSGTSTIAIDDGFSNTGTIEADSGTLALSGTIAQVSGSTFTAGTWNALGGSTIQFPTGTHLTANQAIVTLSGAGASIPALTSLASNTGSLTVTSGATLTTAGNLSSTGILTIGPASTLGCPRHPHARLRRHARYSARRHARQRQVRQLAVTGSAALAGTLQSELVSSYAPNAGDSFRIISFASATGDFTTTDTPIYHGGNLFQAVTNPTSISFTAAASVAESGGDQCQRDSQPSRDGSKPDRELLGAKHGQRDRRELVGRFGVPVVHGVNQFVGRATWPGDPHGHGRCQWHVTPAALMAAVPAVAPGNYFIVVEVDSRGLVPDEQPRRDRVRDVVAHPGNHTKLDAGRCRRHAHARHRNDRRGGSGHLHSGRPESARRLAST